MEAMKSNKAGSLLITALLSASALVAGCSMQVGDKNKEGEQKVAIQTPLGNMKVDTHEVDARDTGLPVYPGARPAEKEGEGNQNKANVNMDTPWFGLKVVALSFETDDPQDKVWAFYKKEMAKYGRVLECKPGSPDANTTNQGDEVLGCYDKDEKDHRGSRAVRENFHIEDQELKVGIPGKQRVVGFKPSAKGTKFSLVYIVTKTSKDTI